MTHFLTELQRDFFASQGEIKNCQVVEFTSVDPRSNEPSGQLHWVRSSCPHAEHEGAWTEFQYQKFTPEEQIRTVQQYPPIPNRDQLVRQG
jgi:hypothetical protein